MVTVVVILCTASAGIALWLGYRWRRAEVRRRVYKFIRKIRSEDEQRFWRERKQIAFGLHDDTVQRMMAVRLRLEEIPLVSNAASVEQEVNGLRQEINHIISALRYLVEGLTQPRFQQISFSALIKMLVESLRNIRHLSISFELENEDKEFELKAEVKENLYYIVHEICHNFLKSSVGFGLLIKLRWGDGLIIYIEDNGQGYSRGRGYGLGSESMETRAKRIGASITHPEVLGKCRILVELPGPATPARSGGRS